MSPEDKRGLAGETEVTTTPGIDERIIKWILVIGVPFLIGFTTWFVIVLAFSQWKIY